MTEPRARTEGSGEERPRARIAQPWPSIPGYRIEGVIGRGATGIVYRARQVVVDREVALKVLHADLSNRPRTIRRLQREARTTARLAHPHIVSAIDMGESEGQWWYAMELVDGVTLSLRLRQEGQLSEREALRLFIPLCEALVHMWENGVVHRDIKPSNILIDRVRGARLADLGLAFADDDPQLTSSEGTLGTPHYISPEQARSPAAADIRSDIWSFGATLFHAVCGSPPFSGESVAEVLSGVLYAPIPDPHGLEPDLSRGFGLVLRKCLSRDPGRRYQTPRELLLDLERVRERRRPKVRARSLEPVEGRMSFYQRVAVGALATLVLAVLVWLFSSGTWWGGSTSEPYGPLEDLARSVESDRAQLAAALARLEDLSVEVPADQISRWRSLRQDLRDRLEVELGAIVEQVGAEVEELLSRDDFADAARLLDTGLDQRLLERTGYTLERVPPGEFRPRVDGLRLRLQRLLEAGRQKIQHYLEAHLQNELLPAVDDLERRLHWRSAEELLAVRDEDLLAASGVEASGFPPGVREDVLAVFRRRMSARRRELDRAWQAIDAELRAWVEERSLELEDLVRQRAIRWDASLRLREGFAGELEERGQPPEEIPLDSASLAELESRARHLNVLERELRDRDASEGVDVLDLSIGWLDHEVLEPLWKERAYKSVLDLTAEFVQDIAHNLGGGSPSLLQERLQNRVHVRAREAWLLEKLLIDASAAVRLLDGKTTELRDGSIGLSGIVRAGLDPLAAGFRLETTAGPVYLFTFRRAPDAAVGTARDAAPRPPAPAAQAAGREAIPVRLSAEAIERLAGLADVGQPIVQPEQRLARALFRCREGQPELAREVLENGEVPEEDEDVVADLERRIEEELGSMRERAEEREAEAARRLEALSPERVTREPDASLESVDRLIEDFADVPEVKLRMSSLRELRAILRKRIQSEGPRPTRTDFERIFAPDAVELLDRDRVRLSYTFDDALVGTWNPGTWAYDALGWSLPRPVVDMSDLVASGRPGGPRLVLHQPLDIDSSHIEVRLRFEQLWESGPPKLLILSAAGFHVAFCGRVLPDASGTSSPARWLIESGGTEAFERLVRRVREGARDGEAELFEPGGRYEIRIEASRRRGRVMALGVQRLGPQPGPYRDLLEGRERSLRAPGDRPGSHSLAVHSYEPIRLLAVDIESGIQTRGG